MKPIIKELLEELTKVGFVKYDGGGYLKNARLKIEFAELSMLISRILTWNKLVAINKVPIKTEETTEFMLIFDIDYNMYSNLFKFCPELKEIFSVEYDRIKFIETLTTEEKDEIRQFINENYTVTIRKTYRTK